MDYPEESPSSPSNRFTLSPSPPKDSEIMPDAVCGVCGINESKYKCLHCALRYCSVACFKMHATGHVDEESKDAANGINGTHTSHPEPPVSTEDADFGSEDSNPDTPGVDPASRRNHPFEAVLRDARFKPLFSKYPKLSEQLQHIEQMTWRPSKFPPINPEETAQGKPPRHVSPFVKGKWEQEKADRIALKKLYELSQQDEGLIEFVTLCNLVLNPEPAQPITEGDMPQADELGPFG